jgi:drug/metabolite transporter (DMT)-like permease
VGVVNNLSPVCCVVLCYFLLGETLAMKEIIFLALIVVCILDIVIFAPPAGDDPTTSSIKEAPFLYLALFMNPFLTAGGTIALRKVKKIHEYVISFWLNLTTLILNLVFVYALG